MPSSRRRGGRALRLPGALLSLVGCAQVLGADDYVRGSARDGAATGDAGDVGDAADTVLEAGPLFADRPPYLSGDACQGCLDEHCAVEDGACEADAFCRTWMSEARNLEVPLIAAYELSARNDAARLAFDRGEGSDAARGWKKRADVETCALNHCRTACEVGRDFSCVGQFDWRKSVPAQTNLPLRFVNPVNPRLGWDGWKVRACAPESACGFWPEVTTRDGGFATLQLDLASFRDQWGEAFGEFNGFLQVIAGDDFLPLEIHESRPMLDGYYRAQRYGTTRDDVIIRLMPAGLSYDGSLGIVAIFPLDCAFSGGAEPRAKGVKIEVWDSATRADAHLCSDCRVGYPDDSGLIERRLTDFSSSTGFPAQVLVPPGEIMVVVRDTQTGHPVSVLTRLNVRKGYVQYVFMFPASRKQLEDLPPNAW